MTRIKVYYDDETHGPYEVVLKQSRVGTNYEATFAIEGSSAVLDSANATGEFLSEAFDHVEQLNFVQAVTMEQEE